MLKLACEHTRSTGEKLSFAELVANYDKLMHIQKIEIFQSGMETAQGDDLAQVLWLKSPNSEVQMAAKRRENLIFLSCSLCSFAPGMD